MVASCPASLMDQTQSRSSKPSRRPFWLAFAAMTPACAPPPPVPDKPEPALAIRVGTSGDYAPFSTRQDDERRGFDIEIALEMARSLQRPVEWVPFAWPELGARVKENAFHVVNQRAAPPEFPASRCVSWRD